MNSIYTQRFAMPVLLVLITVVPGCKKDEVVNPVMASFSVRPSAVDTGDTVTFLNNSINANFYQWNFGDGGTSIEENPKYVYEEEGDYEPMLVAIGTNDSDTATQSVTVTQAFEVTIFPSVGIEEVDIHESWANVQLSLTSDTSHYIRYLPEDTLWRHEVFYYTEGIGLIFISDTTIILDNYGLVFIFLLDGYEGATAEGISIGSSMQKVIQKYGQPENLIEEEELTGYWYDSQGIDFWSLGTGLVDEIDVYDPADFSKKSTSRRSPSWELLRKP